MLSMYDNEQYFFEALKAGASGYVLKSGRPRPRGCVRRRGPRGVVSLPRCRQCSRSQLPGPDPPRRSAAYNRLDQWGRRGGQLIAEGHSSKEIAQGLTISIKTVERTAPTSWRSSACPTAPNSPSTPSVLDRSNHRHPPISPPHQRLIGWFWSDEMGGSPIPSSSTRGQTESQADLTAPMDASEVSGYG
jgi:hypothetical protein